MGAYTALGIAGVALVSLFTGLAFGVALGIRHAEPRYRSPQLHVGAWARHEVSGDMVTWLRQEERRQDCDDGHRAYVCTIVGNTSHVDACDCGATRQGVYGLWS